MISLLFTETNRYTRRPALVFFRDASAVCRNRSHGASLVSRQLLTYPSKRLVVRMRVFFVAPPRQAAREMSNLLRFLQLRAGKTRRWSRWAAVLVNAFAGESCTRGASSAPLSRIHRRIAGSQARVELAPLSRSRETPYANQTSPPKRAWSRALALGRQGLTNDTSAAYIFRATFVFDKSPLTGKRQRHSIMVRGEHAEFSALRSTSGGFSFNDQRIAFAIYIHCVYE